jgi:WD domain, G-beta repeat
VAGRDRRVIAAAVRPAAGSGWGAVAAEDTTCPVCSAATRQERCPRCGWTLFTGYLLGDVTDEDLRAFDEQLAEARRRHYLRAAALAAGYPRHGDEERQRRLARVIPGRAAGDDELREARQSAGQLAVPSAAAPVAGAEAAGAAPPSRPGTVAEVDAGGVTLMRWEPAAGPPAEQAAFSAWSWAQLLPRPPNDADELAFRLASGHEVSSDVLAGLGTAVAGMLRDVPAVEPLFTRCRLTGWVVPEALMAAINRAHPADRLPSDPADPVYRGRAVVELSDPVTALAAVAVGAACGPVRLAYGGPGGAVRAQTTGVSVAVSSPGSHRGRVTAIDVDDAAGLVVSGGRDGSVMAWNAGPAGEPPRPGRQWVVTRHARWVNGVRVTADRVYSLGDDGWFRCTSVRPGVPAGKSSHFAVEVGWECSASLAVTAGGDLAAVAGTAGRVRIMSGDTGALVRWIDVGASVQAMAASSAAGTLAVATQDGVRVHDLRGLRDDAQPLEVASVSCVDAGPAGEVVTGDDAGYVRLFLPPGPQGRNSPAACPAVFTGRHPASVRAVRLLDDGRIVSADADGLIRVWPDHRSPEGGALP